MESESIVDIKLNQYHQFKPRNILCSLTKAMIFSYFNHGRKIQHPMKNYKLFNYVLLVGCVIDVLLGMMVNLHNIFITKFPHCCCFYNPRNFLETNAIRAPSILHKLPQIATKFPQTVRYFRELKILFFLMKCTGYLYWFPLIFESACHKGFLFLFKFKPISIR